jgi:DNA polymerase III psi subunit
MAATVSDGVGYSTCFEENGNSFCILGEQMMNNRWALFLSEMDVDVRQPRDRGVSAVAIAEEELGSAVTTMDAVTGWQLSGLLPSGERWWLLAESQQQSAKEQVLLCQIALALDLKPAPVALQSLEVLAEGQWCVALGFSSLAQRPCTFQTSLTLGDLLQEPERKADFWQQLLLAWPKA